MPPIFFNRKRNSNLSFGSKNCPIDSFVIQTTNGPLYVEEMPEKDFAKSSVFAFDNVLNSFDSFAEVRKGPDKIKLALLQVIKKDLKHCIDKKNGNSTVLIATDLNDNIRALFNLESFDNMAFAQESGFEEPRTAYIQHCLVDEKYRSQGVGQEVIHKLLKTADGNFTDVFLSAENKALNFYKRESFEPLDISNPTIKKVSEFLLTYRPDKPYITLMSKSLDNADPWWARMVKLIK